MTALQHQHDARGVELVASRQEHQAQMAKHQQAQAATAELQVCRPAAGKPGGKQLLLKGLLLCQATSASLWQAAELNLGGCPCTVQQASRPFYLSRSCGPISMGNMQAWHF